MGLNATCGGAAVNTAGLPAMRQAIAELYRRGGTTGRPRITEPDQIHVTAGSHQASSLLVATLAPRGGTVAVAEYSYPGIFDIFDSCEVRPPPWAWTGPGCARSRSTRCSVVTDRRRCTSRPAPRSRPGR